MHPPEPQPAVFGFHGNHGGSILLSDSQQTAERTGSAGDGIVMSRDPMQANKLYEVKSVGCIYTDK